MAKQQQKTSFLDVLMKYRKIIMLSFLFILAPIMLISIFYVNSYNTNKPDPFSETNYISSTMKEINDTKIEIQSFTLDLFYAQTPYDENGNFEYLSAGDGGKITFRIDLGTTVDKNIDKSSLKVKTYACYNWINYTSGLGSYSNDLIGEGERTYSINNFVTDWDKKPFLFVKVDIKDIRFITSFEWTETINGQTNTVTYVFESSYYDLIRDDTLSHL